MKYIKKIEKAKKVLKDNGYYTDNLWHINDVMINAEFDFCALDNEEAYSILNKVMRSSYIMSSVFEMIDNEITEFRNNK